MKAFKVKGLGKWFVRFSFLNHSLRWFLVIHPRMKTTHIKNDYSLNFRHATRASHLRCLKDDCPCLTRDGVPNEVHWDGAINNFFQLGHVPLVHSTIVCRYFKNPLFCVAIYNARIYYVVHKMSSMTWTCIHFGSQNHLVSIGDCHELILVAKELMRFCGGKKSKHNHFNYNFGYK